MEPQIERIYSDFLNRRSHRDSRYQQILQSIDEASHRRKTSLRSDARFFLANNISDMIFRPMQVAHEQRLSLESGPLATEAELHSYLATDLDVVIGAALSVADERERQEISATSVIIGLGNVIDGLQINNAKLWGR
jgi:hypothetical protein